MEEVIEDKIQSSDGTRRERATSLTNYRRGQPGQLASSFFLTLAQAPVLWGWTQGYGVNRLDLYPTHPVALSHLTATANKFHVFLGDSIEAMGPITRRLSLTDSTITSFQLGENMPYKAD